VVQNAPLTGDQTQAYIAERLRIAGASQPVLLPEAAELVHHYSKGIPRIINLICEHALISAYVEQIKPIPARIVESVGMELDLEQQPFRDLTLALSGCRKCRANRQDSNAQARADLQIP
jgi:general secretion pathway protein A